MIVTACDALLVTDARAHIGAPGVVDCTSILTWRAVAVVAVSNKSLMTTPEGRENEPVFGLGLWGITRL